jgi:hypothetical protein
VVGKAVLVVLIPEMAAAMAVLPGLVLEAAAAVLVGTPVMAVLVVSAAVVGVRVLAVLVAVVVAEPDVTGKAVVVVASAFLDRALAVLGQIAVLLREVMVMVTVGKVVPVANIPLLIRRLTPTAVLTAAVQEILLVAQGLMAQFVLFGRAQLVNSRQQTQVICNETFYSN